MRDFRFSIPTSINFGKSALDALPAELDKIGARKIMICYGSDRIRKSGLLSRVEGLLEKSKKELKNPKTLCCLGPFPEMGKRLLFIKISQSRHFRVISAFHNSAQVQTINDQKFFL